MLACPEDMQSVGHLNTHAKPVDFTPAPSFGAGGVIYLELAGCGDDILLVDLRRGEVEAVPPLDRLHVVRVGPERMEGVVRADGEIGVVTDESTAEVITAVDRMRAHLLAGARSDIRDEVVEARVVDVPIESRAVDAALRRRWGCLAGLPGRNDVRTV